MTKKAFFSVDGLKLELIDQPDDLLPTNPPATWPKDFDWLMSALMSTLRQTPSMDGAKLPETTFMALRQLCFLKTRVSSRLFLIGNVSTLLAVILNGRWISAWVCSASC